jgi:hypothetical protein
MRTKAEQVFQIASENMNNDYWLKLANFGRRPTTSGHPLAVWHRVAVISLQ